MSTPPKASGCDSDLAASLVPHTVLRTPFSGIAPRRISGGISKPEVGFAGAADDASDLENQGKRGSSITMDKLGLLRSLVRLNSLGATTWVGVVCCRVLENRSTSAIVPRTRQRMQAATSGFFCDMVISAREG